MRGSDEISSRRGRKNETREEKCPLGADREREESRAGFHPEEIEEKCKPLLLNGGKRKGEEPGGCVPWDRAWEKNSIL